MNSFSISSLHQLPRNCTHKARKIVLSIINSSKTPLSTKDIYKRAVKPAHPNIPAPHVGEEIRSMRYLKTVVLPDLATQNRIEKVRIQGVFAAWLWRLKQVPPTSTTKPETATLINADSTVLTPVAVGVGEDLSHLSKRRQRARKMKIERDLQRMLEGQKAYRTVTLQS